MGKAGGSSAGGSPLKVSTLVKKSTGAVNVFYAVRTKNSRLNGAQIWAATTAFFDDEFNKVKRCLNIPSQNTILVQHARGVNMGTIARLADSIGVNRDQIDVIDGKVANRAIKDGRFPVTDELYRDTRVAEGDRPDPPTESPGEGWVWQWNSNHCKYVRARLCACGNGSVAGSCRDCQRDRDPVGTRVSDLLITIRDDRCNGLERYDDHIFFKHCVDAIEANLESNDGVLCCDDPDCGEEMSFWGDDHAFSFSRTKNDIHFSHPDQILHVVCNSCNTPARHSDEPTGMRKAPLKWLTQTCNVMVQRQNVRQKNHGMKAFPTITKDELYPIVESIANATTHCARTTCGRELVYGDDGGGVRGYVKIKRLPTRASVDRIDNSIGYHIKSNLRIVCMACNKAQRDHVRTRDMIEMTPDLLKDLLAKLKERAK